MNDFCESTDIGSIGHELKAIDHIMQRKMFENASKSGIDKLTIMHGWIIVYLYTNRDKDVFQKDIESKFGIAPSTVTNIVKLMEKKEYISRQSVDSDARLKKLMLTDRGIEMYSKIQTAIEENERRFNSILTDEERETFLNLVFKLKTGLLNN